MESVELIFKNSITEDEFAALVEAAKWRECPGCRSRFKLADGFNGPKTSKGHRYCSARCVSIAERENSLLLKPSPAGLKIDGWDV